MKREKERKKTEHIETKLKNVNESAFYRNKKKKKNVFFFFKN